MTFRRWSSSTRRLAVPEGPGGGQQDSESICSWEIPLDHELVSYVEPEPGWRTGYIPSRWRSIPEAAVEALTELISVGRPHDMLVAPAGVRRVRGAYVYCPTQVLAAGEHGVALWVDALPFDRVASVLAYRDIRMLEHRSAAESAHLTVIGAAARCTLHYRPSCLPDRDSQLQTLLTRIRRRAAGLSSDFAQRGDDPGRQAAPSTVGEGGASRVVLSCSAPGWMKWVPWVHHNRGGWQTAALGDYELVVRRGPASRWDCHVGKDILAVPRIHLRGLTAAGPSLCIDAGVTRDVTLGASFARRLVREFSSIAGESPAHPSETHQGSADVRY